MPYTTDRKKILFVLNPVAGTTVKKEIPGEILKHLDLGKYEPVILFSEKPGHARELTREYLKEGVEIVFAIGGDGTVNEVAGALVHTPSVLGIIPMGSGNGLARHFRLPFNLRKGLSLLDKGRVLSIDYGIIHQIPFFCTAGVGFDAYVGKLFSEDKNRGFPVYVKMALKALVRYKPLHYQLSVDGYQFETEAFLITFANASQYGNEAIIAPSADVTDGKMDMVIFSSFPLVTAPALGIRLFTRDIDKSRFVHIVRCNQAQISCPREQMVIHFDGETGTTGSEIDVRMVREGLKILIPS